MKIFDGFKSRCRMLRCPVWLAYLPLHSNAEGRRRSLERGEMQHSRQDLELSRVQEFSVTWQVPEKARATYSPSPGIDFRDSVFDCLSEGELFDVLHLVAGARQYC